jgi:predicted MFS family arabinose efflux permease
MFVDRFERKRLLLDDVRPVRAWPRWPAAWRRATWTLLAARGTAGAFGGVLGSMVQTMVGDLIPFERRGRASGTIMSAFSLSTVAGVPLSLWLANHFGWRFRHSSSSLLLSCVLAGCWAGRCCRHCAATCPTAAISEAERDHPLSAMFAVLRRRQPSVARWCSWP